MTIQEQLIKLNNKFDQLLLDLQQPEIFFNEGNCWEKCQETEQEESYMRKDVVEANVVLAKCRKSHRTYGIRIERRTDNAWYCTWAFPISETGASNEGYGSTMISGRVITDPEYPGCPYCGGGAWVSCGRCKKLTCWGSDEKVFKCAWCNNSGEVTVAETFDLQGGGY